ncbi:hypothetical protein DVR12_15950 [Chitinophaga silvatica]|uniref:Uncharacterized protein n=1 Tax=Chitinophaga silvatica TaxID=2282649 RepID=A0A3E1Y885_9BACT|nr:hypothetical protein [Chitinophaga silvatica]RFS21390.1 hypothetical protein DVR12_15950 [Chitinophaga silvatica]
MEKISALIEKLLELKNSGADLATISYYVQLLQAEVLRVRTLQHLEQLDKHANVAVILPSQQPITVAVSTTETEAQTTTLPSNNPVAAPVPKAEDINIAVNNNTTYPYKEAETPAPKHIEKVIPVTELNNQVRETEDINSAYKTSDVVDINTAAKAHEITDLNSVFAKQTTAPEPPPPPPVTKVIETPIPAPARSQATLFDPTPETKEVKEVKESTGQSLNDRLRLEKQELAQKLGEIPIKDLRQAIGINDKYQFIEDLFNGDRDLYERSIKTLNDFTTLQEADYWLQREIKIIQGWQDDHKLVQQFYALLRKRFS